jgi:hypothetical protein
VNRFLNAPTAAPRIPGQFQPTVNRLTSRDADFAGLGVRLKRVIRNTAEASNQDGTGPSIRMNKALIVVVFVTIVSLAVIPVSLAWRQLLKHPSGLASSHLITEKLPLLVTSLSCTLFLVALVYPTILGPFYSNRRFTTIWTNLGLTLLMALFSSLGKHRSKLIVTISAALTAFVWLYAWIVNAAV